MRMTTLFGRRLREKVSQAETASHDLLLRAGYVRQQATGIYSYLTLGVKSLRKIERIVREEMDSTGAQEILMTMVQDADSWRRSGRYESVDATMVRFQDRRGHDLVLGMTHEEIVAELAASEIRSYRSAGVVVYQIQSKFRDELRSRGGLLRTREFVMKDAYSLHLDQTGLDGAYRVQAEAYHRIFRRVGMSEVYQVRSATGMMGGTLAHEFMALMDIGDDTVAFCGDCGEAANSEALGEAETCTCGATLEKQRAVEVGNIFQLGTRYTEALGARVTGPDGESRALVMGSYGIGVSRMLAVLVEQCHDDSGIALTAATAAMDAHVVCLGQSGSAAVGLAERCYTDLRAADLDVLLDDRELRAGEKFAEADLIGATLRITIGRRAETEGVAEVKERRTGQVHEVAIGDLRSATGCILADILQREGAHG